MYNDVSAPPMHRRSGDPRDRPYKTPAEEGRENDGVVSPAPVCHRRLRHCSARVPRLRWRMGL